MPFLPMRKNTTLNKSAPRWFTIFAAIIALIFVAAINDANAQFTFASDRADNYGGGGEPGWTNASDAGTGFGGWGFSGGGVNAGSFLGNPTNSGINNNIMGSEAFGMFSSANNSGYANRSRGFDVGMGIGDVFTFDWGMNFDSGSSGAKGFDIRSGGTTLFTLISSNSATITFTNLVNSSSGTASGSYGTNNMAVTLTRTATGYTFTMTSRNTGSLFTTNISTSSTIDNFNFFIGDQQDNNANRNMFFDNLSITNSGVFSSGGTVTNANTFSGSGALSIGNSTTLILSGGGNNNYTGATTISNGSTLTFAGAGTSTFASTIGGGTGNVIMSNASGTVILTNNNTYTGNTTVAAGRLLIGNASALGSTGTLTVSSGGQLQLSNGITMSRGITLSGDGVSSTGALLNVNGSNTWSGNITNASGARIGADAGTTLTIGGNIVNSGGGQNFYVGGAGNVTINGTLDGTATAGNGALFKDGSGVLTLSNNNTSLSGLVRILGGTVRVGTAGTLGTGTVEIGGTGALSTTSNLTRTAGLTVTDASGGAVVDVASGTTFTQTGAFTGAPTASTKIGKAGAGDLIFNAASGSTYGGQIQIGEGRVIVGTTGALGTNASTGNRGIDLGLNVGDTSQANNVALLASNGVTVGQSIYVDANTGGATRTIGLSGSGTN
ncbi:MAG: beta strand repeat-containing protein, partial [Chthoniobacterales bacterium]